MSRSLRVGISTCPNDTFAFHALLSGEVATPGLELTFELRDVQELNERFLAGDFDVAKVSFHAALLARDTVILPSGSALGWGVGPLLLAAPGRAAEPPRRVLCPGATTTATLLWRLFHGERGEPEQVVFSEILPALERGEADWGVCIHEGRFTYRRHGLECVEDLGERWEREARTALPLGGIAARRGLGPETIGRVQAALAESLARARAAPEQCLSTMRAHARELADDVLWSHVELYVNRWTDELGAEGRAALGALSRLARERGLVGAGPPLEVHG